MKRFIFGLLFALLPAVASAQCTGVFPNNSLCGNFSGSPKPPGIVNAQGTIVVGPATSTNNGLPLWANTTGTLLKDGAGGTIAGNYTWGGTQTYSAANIFNSTANFVGVATLAAPVITGNATVGAVVTTGQTGTGKFVFDTGPTLSAPILGTPASGTLTNATGLPLTTGVTGILPSANGGTGVASPATHTIPINQGASAQANTGTGTLGQALFSNGASVDPSFKSGAWTLLNTFTGGGTAYLDTTSFTSSYNEYELVFANVIPATNAVTCLLQVHSGGSVQGASYLGSGFTTNATAIITVNSTASIQLCNTTTAGNSAPGINGTIRVSNPSVSGLHPWVGVFSYWTGAALGIWPVQGMWNSAAVVTGFQFSFSSGNITSGTIKVYGRL